MFGIYTKKQALHDQRVSEVWLRQYQQDLKVEEQNEVSLFAQGQFAQAKKSAERQAMLRSSIAFEQSRFNKASRRLAK